VVKLPPRLKLYDADRIPVEGFNGLVHEWLRDKVRLVEHSPPAAFDFMRTAYELEVENLLTTEEAPDVWTAHRTLLSDLTRLMFGDDISGRLSSKLSAERINPAGFRSQLTQSVAKNTGENFINAIVYALAACLRDQDDVLIDKGMAAPLRPLLTLERHFAGSSGQERFIQIPIEVDVSIWLRSDPTRAIIVNAKTRLKEIFHIGTMWKLLYDMIGDKYARAKWELEGSDKASQMKYVFATADMIRTTGTGTQGPDVEREEVRNLIAMDAAFFDYTFVSKTGIGHVSPTLELAAGREALFHELGCLLDLVQQAFPEVALP
jgi:hypothetical protein